MTNIQNIDGNEFYKLTLVRYLHPVDHHPARIVKPYKDFAKKHDFKDINCQSLHSPQIDTQLKKRSPLTLVFFLMKTRKNIQSMYQENVLKKKIFSVTLYKVPVQKKLILIISLESPLFHAWEKMHFKILLIL